MVATHLRQSRPSHVSLHSVLNKYTENFILVSVVIFEPQIFSDFRLSTSNIFPTSDFDFRLRKVGSKKFVSATARLFAFVFGSRKVAFLFLFLRSLFRVTFRKSTFQDMSLDEKYFYTKSTFIEYVNVSKVLFKT